MVISARRFDTGVEAGESFFFHADTQGNVRDLRKSDGSLEQSYSYRAFGEQLDVPEHYGGQVPAQSVSTHYGGQEVPSVSAVEPRYGGQASGTGYSNDKNAYRFEGLYGYYTDSPSRTYVRARHYAPQQGRWISSDPIGFRGEDRNFYRFVQNNPASWIDPGGLRRKKPSIWPCKKLSPGACFKCEYERYRSNLRFQYCPEKACDLANLACGSHIHCGGCGPTRLNNAPAESCNPFALEKYAKYLHGMDPYPDGSCGGGQSADKLAHCWMACNIGRCYGAFCWKGRRFFEPDEPADEQAEDYGLACVNQGPFGGTTSAQCFACCKKSTYHMICD